MGRTPVKKTPRTEPVPTLCSHPANPKLLVVTVYKCSDGEIIEDEEAALLRQAEIDEYSKNRGFLPWEYCECGCKGHELVISKDCMFWCYQPEPIGRKFVVRTGHGILGALVGTFKSWREVDEAIAPIIKAAAKNFDGILKTIAEREKSPGEAR